MLYNHDKLWKTFHLYDYLYVLLENYLDKKNVSVYDESDGNDFHSIRVDMYYGSTRSRTRILKGCQ